LDAAKLAENAGMFNPQMPAGPASTDNLRFAPAIEIGNGDSQINH
jgi:hypothetical protein